MFCPQCRGEFRSEIVFCANCQTDLVDTLPEDDIFASEERMAEALAEEPLVTAFEGSHAGLREAQRVLAQHRIASVIASDDGELSGPAMHARLSLLLRKDDIEAAREVFASRWRDGVAREGLQITDSDDLGKAEACPACGVAVPLDAEVCSECGLFVGAAAADDGDDSHENEDR